MIRIGLIGLVHDHIWIHGHLDVAKQLAAEGKAQITSVADPNPPLVEKFKESLGANLNAYKNYKELLDHEKVDACVLFTETSKHKEIVEECAKRGIHVQVEKPLATNLDEAKRVKEIVEKSKIKLFINFPTDWRESLRGCFKLIESGKIGRVWGLRYRTGHHGPKEAGCSDYFVNWLVTEEGAGGGALVDFCCYGAYYAVKYLGKPDYVIGSKGLLVKRDYLKVEDNAVLILGYKDAMAVVEGTWAQIPGGIRLEIYGEKGSIFTDPKGNFWVFAGEVKAVSGAVRLSEIEWEPVEKVTLAREESSALRYFVNVIEKDLNTNLEDALSAQEIIEAGKRSAKTGERIYLKK